MAGVAVAGVDVSGLDIPGLDRVPRLADGSVCGGVLAGWLGANGDSLAQLSESEFGALGIERKR